MPTVNRYDIFTSTAIGYVDTILPVGFMISGYHGKLQIKRHKQLSFWVCLSQTPLCFETENKTFREAADYCLNCPRGNHKP